MSATTARKNGNRHHHNAGAAGFIREKLDQAKKPMTIEALSFATGLKRESVKAALSTLVHHTGGVRCIRASNGGPTTYERIRRKQRLQPRKPHNGHVAGPITVPQFRWGSSRLNW